MRIDETDSVTEPELLMEVMEIREALEEAQTEERVDQIRQDNKGMHARPSSCPQTPLADPVPPTRPQIRSPLSFNPSRPRSRPARPTCHLPKTS